MAIYTEQNLKGLLEGAIDPQDDTITVRRINGAVITVWPHSEALAQGVAIIEQTGAVRFDNQGTTSGFPAPGAVVAAGSFSFTLWDGSDESDTYTATLQLVSQPSWDSSASRFDTTILKLDMT